MQELLYYSKMVLTHLALYSQIECKVNNKPYIAYVSTYVYPNSSLLLLSLRHMNVILYNVFYSLYIVFCICILELFRSHLYNVWKTCCNGEMLQ